MGNLLDKIEEPEDFPIEFDAEIEQEEEIDPAEEDEIKAVETLLSELGEGVDHTIKVYRKARGKRLSFLFEAAPGELTMGEIEQRLRDEYDGGTFRIQIRKGNRYLANRLIEIEAPKKEEKLATNNTGDSIRDLILMIQESNRAQSENLQQMMLKQADNNQKLLLGIIQAQNNKPEPVQQNPLEMLTAMGNLKELFAPAKDNSIETLIQGITLAKELSDDGGEANSSSVLQTAIKTFGGPIAAIAEQIQHREGAGQTQTVPKPGPVEQIPKRPAPVPVASDTPMKPSPETVQPEPEKHTNVLYNQAMQPFITQLCQLAENKHDTLEVANYICDQMGDEKAYEFMSPENKIDELEKDFPEITPHKAWFNEVHDILLGLFSWHQGDIIDTPAPETDQEAVINVLRSTSYPTNSSPGQSISNAELPPELEPDADAANSGNAGDGD